MPRYKSPYMRARLNVPKELEDSLYCLLSRVSGHAITFVNFREMPLRNPSRMSGTTDLLVVAHVEIDGWINFYKIVAAIEADPTLRNLVSIE